MILECPICDKSFEQKNMSQEYCSQRCVRQLNNQRAYCATRNNRPGIAQAVLNGLEQPQGGVVTVRSIGTL